MKDFVEQLEDVTRFEVIDETGRALARYGVHVELHYQDNGRTLKVFLGKREHPLAESDVRRAVADGLSKAIASVRDHRGVAPE
jgi:hypothetical protein